MPIDYAGRTGRLLCKLGCEGISALLALPLRPQSALDQVKESEVTRGEARGREGVAMNNSAWPLIPSVRLRAMTSSFFSRLHFAHRFRNGCHTFSGTN